jgi:type IV pilus assembly protein PilV
MGILVRNSQRRQAGFTMVETLVALVVLAIGLLGIAALYLDSLRAGRTAIYRTQAVNLAADLADRIRTNRSALAGYTIDLGDDGGDVGPVGACLTTAGCSPADMAGTDLQAWKTRLAQLLPDGDGSVAVVAGAGGEPSSYTIVVQWTEVGEAAPLTYQLVIQT